MATELDIDLDEFPELVEAHRLKTTAEAENFAAEAEKYRAEAKRALAGVKALLSESRANDAGADLTVAQTREATASARAAEIAVEDLVRAERRFHASDGEHRVYQFGTSVSEGTVRSCIHKLTEWHRLDGADPRPLTIVFNSPGGAVIEGFALWDHIQELRRAGHHVTTMVRGMAASMAGILLQAGDTRVVGAESVLLIHEISFGAGGKIGEVEDEVAFAKMLTQRVLKILAARSTMTERQIDARWKRRDWWIGSEDALRLGFADEVR